MTSRIRRPLTILLATLVIALAGYSGRSLASPAHTSPDKVYFILNWLPNVEFAGLWVAQQKGYFKQNHIDMSFKGWANGVAPETDVPARGGNTFGFQSGAALIIAASKGVPDVSVYTDTQRSVFGLSVLASSGIKSLKQLKGKRIGYQSHEFYVPATMMSCAGVPQSAWKPVTVGFDPSVLVSKQVDAYLVFTTNEPIGLALQGVKVNTFRAYQHCFNFYDDVMFTTSSLVKSNPDLVRRVVNAVARGFQWAHSHPVQAARLTVGKYFPASTAGSGVSAQQNLKQQELELEAFTEFSRTGSGQYHGRMSLATWQASINTLVKYGEISSKPSAASLFTNRFNPYSK